MILIYILLTEPIFKDQESLGSNGIWLRGTDFEGLYYDRKTFLVYFQKDNGCHVGYHVRVKL